jgi:hypothetical protein
VKLSGGRCQACLQRLEEHGRPSPTVLDYTDYVEPGDKTQMARVAVVPTWFDAVVCRELHGPTATPTLAEYADRTASGRGDGVVAGYSVGAKAPSSWSGLSGEFFDGLRDVGGFG